MNNQKRFQYLFVFLLTVLGVGNAFAQVAYPFPSHHFNVNLEGKQTFVSYMDVAPATPNGKTVLLFHGKNFNGYYWKDLIPVLTGKGFRVIAPDFLGWGRSAKPDLHYSFHMLASVNKALLDSLHISSVIIIAHSMGGMVGVRYALMFPASVSQLVLENPIGLEDYKTFVPYQPLEQLYQTEKSATYASYRKYQQGYYPTWKPAYEQYVQAQADALKDPAFDSIARVNAITYQMIYEQPVVYELSHLAVPTLLIIGQADRTIVGKDKLNGEQQQQHGNYPQLGAAAAAAIKGSRLIPLEGVGHIAHIQEPAKFVDALFTFL